VLARWTYQLGGQVLDSGGAPAVSRLREPLLRQIASRGSGSYLHAGDPARALTFARLFAVPVLEAPSPPMVRDWSSYDLTFWFALAALLLLMMEALLDVRISLPWRVMQRRNA
jgi:hypothetical protein